MNDEKLAEAVERLTQALDTIKSYCSVTRIDLRTLLDSWKQRGEEIERLAESVAAVGSNRDMYRQRAEQAEAALAAANAIPVSELLDELREDLKYAKERGELTILLDIETCQALVAALAAANEEVHAENEKFRKADELAQMWEQRERMKTGELAAANERWRHAERIIGFLDGALQTIVADAGSHTVARDYPRTSGFGFIYDVARKALAREALRSTPAAKETVHACPPTGSGLTPCCGKTPFELSGSDRLTLDPALVTCAPQEPKPLPPK